MSTEENKALVRREYEQGVNPKNFRVRDEVLAGNFVAHFPGHAPIHGIEAFREFTSAFFTASIKRPSAGAARKPVRPANNNDAIPNHFARFPMVPRHLLKPMILKPMTVRMKQVFGFRSCLSCGRLV